MTHEMISIENPENGNFKGYLSLPTSGKGPGLVMLQEIFGVNSSMRATADHFAKKGYTVLVPDLFWRLDPGVQLSYEGEGLKKAFEYFQRYDVQQGVTDVGYAIETLRAHTACSKKVGLLGFCLGGKLAYIAAASYKVDVAVSFYGVGIDNHLDLAASIRCPVQMHFGDKDEGISMEHVARVKNVFKNRADAEIQIYKEAGHAFYNRTRPSYDSDAAMLADERTLAFLEDAFLNTKFEVSV